MNERIRPDLLALVSRDEDKSSSSSLLHSIPHIHQDRQQQLYEHNKKSKRSHLTWIVLRFSVAV